MKKIILCLICFMILLTGCAKKSAEKPEFEDGMAQPVFDYTKVTEDYNNEKSSIVRFCVWVETDIDTDNDGEKDLVKALVQLPRAAYEGKYKAAAIYEARPYIAGENETTITKSHKEDIKDVNIDPEDWYYKLSEEDEQYLYEDLTWYDYFLVRGFAVVSSAGLGTLGSDGYMNVGSKEETDGFQSVIEWIHGDRTAYTGRSRTTEISADWSNKKIGMTGRSYAGTTQYALAERAPEGLETIVPVAGIVSWYGYVNGQGVSTDAGNNYMSFLSHDCNSIVFNEEQMQRIRDGYYQMLDETDKICAELNGNYGDYWEERNYGDDMPGHTIPMLIVQGFNDQNVRSNQLYYLADSLLYSGNTESKYILHQGAHVTPAMPSTNAEIMIGDMSYDEILNKWFSHYLYGIENDIEDMPEVMLQSNVDGSWKGIQRNPEKCSVASFALEAATLSSETLPKTFDDWNEDVWYKQNNSAVKRYELFTAGEEGFDIIEQVSVNLKITLDKIYEGQENFMLSAYLVDEYDEGFDAYLCDDSDQVPTKLIRENAFVQVPGVSAMDRVEYKPTRTDHKIVSRGWIDLCNPDSNYKNISCTKQENPVEQGKTYLYGLVLDPVYYTVSPGHKLVLYVFPYDLGRIEDVSDTDRVGNSFFRKLELPYSFTINRKSSATMLTGLDEDYEEPVNVKPDEYELKSEKKIIIDSDTAGDDAMAIAMAAKSPNVKIMGVTVLPGNVDMEQAVNNALMTLEVAGSDAPVYKGSYTFLSGEAPETYSIFGEDGMGDSDLIHPKGKAQDDDGIDFIIDTVNDNPGEIEIVAIGPVTNVAKAIQKAPDIMKKTARVWVMGTTGQAPGNATPVAEFNTYKDPEAMSILLKSGIPVTVVGWDMALDDRTYFYYDDLGRMSKIPGIGLFLSDAFSILAQNKLRQYGNYYIDVADPIAMAACIWPDYLTETRPCYAYCSFDKNFPEVYGQVVFYDKEKVYDALFEIPPANCDLAASQKSDEFVDRVIELLGR